MVEKAVVIAGESGDIEAKLATQAGDTLLVVCHPHPQFAGTMDNKVVTTTIAAGQNLQMQTMRFNYRGVGASAGSYGDIVGEVADARAVLRYAQEQLQYNKLILSGFSFGAYVAAAVANEFAAANLVCISPSLDRMPYETLGVLPDHTLVVQGMADEVVSADAAVKWAQANDFEQYLLQGVGHFYHRKLVYLRSLLQAYWSNL